MTVDAKQVTRALQENEWRMSPKSWLLIGCLALEAGRPEQLGQP
jgi:hypothetical protein